MITIYVRKSTAGLCQNCGHTPTYGVSFKLEGVLKDWYACGSHLPRVMRLVGAVIRPTVIE